MVAREIAKAAIAEAGKAETVTDDSAMVSRGEVRRAFAQVDGHIQGLAKMFNHNGQVVQQGFLSNDVWFETLRLITFDAVKTLTILCEQAGVVPDVKLKDGAVDMAGYWETAHANVQASMAQQAKLRAEQPQEPVVAAPGPDDEVLEFGGDFNPVEEESTDAVQAL